mgnify:CR=1 FL=1
MFTKNKIIKVIQSNTEEIKGLGVKRIGIFGSFINSAANNKSDIDVLIEFQKGKKRFDNYMELKFFLEKIFHRKIDLVIKEALKPRIKKNIIREVLYARI